jgi:hypothetical protein
VGTIRLEIPRLNIGWGLPRSSIGGFKVLKLWEPSVFNVAESIIYPCTTIQPVGALTYTPR